MSRPGLPIDVRAPTMQGNVPAHLSRSRATLRWGAAEGRAPAGSEPIVLTEPEQRSADVFASGDRIGEQYEIRRLLGSGGMGQVYEAQDLALNRVCALKVAWPHVGPEPLRREAQVLAAFRHPGLVTAYALNRWREHEYLVMERITGAPLADRLQQRGPLSFTDALPIFASICDTLSVLHASGLAHSDLKPANIMIAAGDRVVLLDFGIVRIEQLRSDKRRISGSPHYMAPETIRGEVRPGEAHLVDVYALGVIIFVALTGQAPFDHADPMLLMMQHLDVEPPRLRALLPNAPVALDSLVASMLSKQPEHRPDRIELVRDELRSIGKKLG